MFKKKIVIVLALVLSAIMILSGGLTVSAENVTYPPDIPEIDVELPDNIPEIDVELPDDSFISRTFTVSRFNHVIVGGNWIVTYVQAPNHAIRVEMPSRWFDNYNFNVRSRTLRVERRGLLPGLTDFSQPRLYVYAPSLDSVNLSGFAVAENWSTVAGRDFTINISGAARANFDLEITRNLTVNSSGTARLTLSGNTRDLRINGSGVVHIEAFELQARDARPVNLGGVGFVEISVSDRLNIQAAGTTRIYYRGDPRITQRITRSVQVIQVD